MISAQEVADKLAAGEQVALLDVRTEGEFASGYIAGAKLLSVYGLTPEQLQEAVTAAAQGGEVVLYCASGARSDLACRFLHEQGVTAVRSMSGGLAAWQAAGLPVARD